MVIEFVIGAFIIGLGLGALFCYKIINYIGTKSQLTVMRTDNQLEFSVLGNVVNTTEDRIGQPMVLYGNKAGQYFVETEQAFQHKFKEVK